MLNIFLPIFLGLATFVFAPLTTNFFYTPKIITLTLAILIFLIFTLYRLWRSQTLRFPSPTFLKYAAIFPLSLVINFLLIREARLESFLNYGLLYLMLLTLSYLISLESAKSKLIHVFEISVIYLSSALALYTILHLIYLYSASFLPLFMQTRSFTPTGSPLATLFLLLAGTILCLTHIFGKRTSNTPSLTFIFPLLATIQIIAIMSYFSLVLPGQELSPTLLPFRAGWTILLDSWKNPRILLSGVGLANFGSLFTQTKPLFLNTTALWNVNFQQSSSELLQLFSTLGILGGIGFGSYLFYGLIQLKTSSHAPTLRPLLLLTIISLLFLPGNILSLSLFFMIIALLAPAPTEFEAPQSLRLTLLLLTLIPTLYCSYLVGKYALAELSHYQSQQSLARNDGQSVYRYEQRATSLLPYYTSYRLGFSQVNLALAGAISQKQSLSDTDKSTVTTLTSQAIQEAKVTTTLRPNSRDSWQNLATIYRNLIGVAEGADEFAVNSFAKAVSLDPASPTLRLEFAGLLQQLAGKATTEEQKTSLLSRSLQEYLRSVEIKPDYANGYYNISKLYESQGNYERATIALTQAVAYLDPESTDHLTANQELETLKAKLPKNTPTPSPSPITSPSPTPASSELTTPSPLPSPLATEPLNITN